LSLQIGAGEPLARTLHRKAELVKHSRDVLRVVVDLEPLLDPFADEGSGPHARLKPSRFGTSFDNTRDLSALVFAQSRLATGQWSRAQPLGPLIVVPTGPLRNCGTVDADLLRKADRRLPLDVAKHALCAPPHREILHRRGFTQQLP
jgi:hypothetical protein